MFTGGYDIILAYSNVTNTGGAKILEQVGPAGGPKAVW